MSQVWDEIQGEMGMEVHADSAIQHLAHLLEGYRERILSGKPMSEKPEPPYSPGSARGNSWDAGVEMAKRDLLAGRVVRLSSEES